MTTPVHGEARRMNPASIADMKAQSTALVPLSWILPSKLQVRRTITPESILDLTTSIERHGIIEPLVVRQTEAGMEIVCGYRRYSAARAARLREVPVHIREISDQNMLVLALSENIHRNEMSLVEEAEAYKSVLESGRVRTQAELANIVGVSRGRISQVLAVFDLPAELRESVFTRANDAGKVLTERHVRILRAIGNRETQRELAGEAFVRGLSAEALRARVESFAPERARRSRRPIFRRTRWTRMERSRYCRTRRGLRIEVQGNSGLELLRHLESLIESLKIQLIPG